MKILLTAIVVACGVMLPVTQAQAAPAGKSIEFAGKRYGDFAPGKKFTFTVREVICAKATLTGGSRKAPVPQGVPKFRKGQKVKFAIGSKGELKGPGFAIKFEADGVTSNVYVNRPKKGSKIQADTASVFKDSANKPTAVALTFFKTKGSGFGTEIYSVYYTLD